MELDASFLSKVVAGLVTILVGLIATMWRSMNSKLETKTDQRVFDELRIRIEGYVTTNEFKQTIDENQRQFSLVNLELAENKNAVVKLVDRINTMEENNTRRHIDLLTAIHNNGGSHTKLKG